MAKINDKTAKYNTELLLFCYYRCIKNEKYQNCAILSAFLWVDEI